MEEKGAVPDAMVNGKRIMSVMGKMRGCWLLRAANVTESKMR